MSRFRFSYTKVHTWIPDARDFFTAPLVSSRCTSLEDGLLAREASACVV